ncbi:hypothetical protein DNH61_22185 [Paenibacillus sambharensis]|uniref:Aminodeoxychorismate lyase n=1 Tax=Paenibacillus sambharensis TaxID=1803190 RepID=A0A2W1L5D8_9BACL|nr:hypothetical protein [Paenibacillus sambharensis]PZD93350.1 hypothetical protein DNH61_22185 [Paenibacillus sambharensis]
MFRNRTFLFGLGIGIIVGALLLQLMYVSEQQAGRAEQGPEDMYTQEQVDDLIAEAKQRLRAELQAPAEEESAADDTKADDANAEGTPESGEPAKADGPSKEAETAPVKSGSVKEAPAAEPETMTVSMLPVRIKSGMNLTQIASLLKSKGVIADEKVFLTIMTDYSSKIVAGFYYFDGELTYADVKKIITSPPFAT